MWMSLLFVIVPEGVFILFMPRPFSLKRKAPTFSPSLTVRRAKLLLCVLRLICVIRVSMSCGDGGRGMCGACVELYLLINVRVFCVLWSDIKWCLIVRRSRICVGGIVDLSRTVMGKMLQ